MASGGVGVVMVHGANPAYTLPAASGFGDAFERVPFKVSFASAPDETAALADLILPDLHYLESWGDSNPRSGIHAIQQPVMRPVTMFDGKQTGDVMLSLSARLGRDLGSATFRDYLRAAWGELRSSVAGSSGPDGADDAWWRDVLRSGVLPEAGVATGAQGDDGASPPLRGQLWAEYSDILPLYSAY